MGKIITLVNIFFRKCEVIDLNLRIFLPFRAYALAAPLTITKLPLNDPKKTIGIIIGIAMVSVNALYLFKN